MFQNEERSSNSEGIRKSEEKTGEQLGMKYYCLTPSRLNNTYSVLTA